jgi:hypothetical protein
MAARRKAAMGVESLRPWDLDGFPDPLGRAPLRPFSTEPELTQGGAAGALQP